MRNKYLNFSTNIFVVSWEGKSNLIFRGLGMKSNPLEIFNLIVVLQSGSPKILIFIAYFTNMLKIAFRFLISKLLCYLIKKVKMIDAYLHVACE